MQVCKYELSQNCDPVAVTAFCNKFTEDKQVNDRTIDPQHVLNTNTKPWSLHHLVTSPGSGHLLALETDKLPLVTNEQTELTCERYTIDAEHVWNTNGKPWWLYRQVTLLPVSDAP
jgi:hypothetical protein